MSNPYIAQDTLDEDVETFKARRRNKPATAKETKSSRRTIARPTKDYFAPTGGAK